MSEKYISSINIDETIYQIKDKEAREQYTELQKAVDSKVDLEENSNVNAVLNFVNGVQINGAEIKSTKDASGNDIITFS